MGLDMNKLKERLQKLQSKGGSSERTDYAKIFFKPQVGKQTVRIVPNKFNADIPFTEVIFHNQNVFKKSIYSLENWGEKDPVMQLRRELFNDEDADTKEMSIETAKKLAPRTKAFVQVIIRGRESEGVKLWELNKTTYEKILTIMAQDDEYGDITDIMEGTDLTVEGYTDKIAIGKKTVEYIAVNITPKRKPSPLATDEKVIEDWLENQKNPLEVHKKYTYDELKALLRDWLNPEDEDGEDEDEDEVVAEKPAPKTSKAKPVEVDDEDEDEDEEEPKPIARGKVPTKVQETKKSLMDQEDEDEDEDDAPFEVVDKKKGALVKGGKALSKKGFDTMFDEE